MEGAQLPWKVQKIDTSRGPPADYSSLCLPLPKPPKGMEWVQDKETREWRLSTAVQDLHPEEQGQSNLSASKGCAEESEGKKNLEHLVLPSDTLAGICIRYKVTATQLRQANCFSGSNLSLAPQRLIIPTNGLTIPVKQDDSSPEYKLRAVMAALPQLNRAEAKAYLQMSDWEVERAIEGAEEDLVWEESSALLEAHEAIPLPLNKLNKLTSSVEHPKERELEMSPLLSSVDMRFT